MSKLVERLLTKEDICVGIKYFSAPRRLPELVEVQNPQKYADSNERQRIYFEALRSIPNLDIILGWYSENDPHQCVCGNRWVHFEEKVTDVNIATHMLCDAYERKLDKALLLSADADLVPAVEAVQKLGIEFHLVLMPGRKRAKHLRKTAQKHVGIKIKHLRAMRLPDTIKNDPYPPIVCPERWRKPQGWVWAEPKPMNSLQGDNDPPV